MSARCKICCICLLLLLLQKMVLSLTCGLSNFTNTLTKEEYDSINTSYTTNITASPDVPDTFNAVYQVCEGKSVTTACTFIYDKDYTSKFKKDLSEKTGVTCYWEQRDVSSSVVLDINITQVVTRSLSVMMLSTGRGGRPKPTLLIHINVLYSPNVTSLIVDGNEVNGDYIINERKEVSIFCFVDKGNPRVSFQLLDKYGSELKSDINGGHLNYSLTARCQDEWPVVRCEGSRSIRNRSVSLLVRCPPQFADNSTKIISLQSFESLVFHVKAHTETFAGCHLTRAELDKIIKRGVSCILSGNPPDLVLSVYLHKETSISQGNWTLILSNEKGSASTTLNIIYGGGRVDGVEPSSSSVESITTKNVSSNKDFNKFKKDLSEKTGVTCYWEQRNVSSSVVAVDINITQVVTRSLSAMIFSTSRGGIPKPTRLIRVEVLYLPNITNLTVDGGENVINQGQVLNVSCYFEKGNPPGVFYLLDKYGTKLNSSSYEGHLSSSLTARCEDDWPTVRCEGNGSQQNRSVTVLVKCRPQFVDKSRKIVSPALDTVTFGVKAHTTAVNCCLLTSLSVEHNTTRGVNCTLTGDPPDLVLSLQLEKEDDSFRGKWTLTLSNDWGSSNTTFIVLDGSMSESSPALTLGKTINIELVCGIVVTVVLFAVAGTFAVRKVKGQRYGSDVTKRPTVGNRESSENRRRSCSTVIVNDVYETNGAVDNNNDIIHTCSPPRRDPHPPLNMSEVPARPPRSQHAQTRVTAADVHSIPPNEFQALDQVYVSSANVRQKKKTTKTGNAALGADENTYVYAPEVREKKRLKKQVGAGVSRGDAYVSARDVRKEKTKARKECRTSVGKFTDEAQTAMSPETPSCSRNDDGLIYGDLDFTTTSSSKAIIGAKSEIEYADIKGTAIVPPPRDYKQKIDRRKKE